MRPTPRDPSDTTVYACDSCGGNICPAEGELGNLCQPCEKDLTIWHTDYDWVIATTKEDAAQVMAELCGGSYEDYLDDFEKYNKAEFTMHVAPDDEEGDVPIEKYTKVIKPVAEWIKEHGRGLFCTED